MKIDIQKELLNAPITISDLENKDICVSLVFHGSLYRGIAHCAKQDMDFYSRKVGIQLAHYRAMKEAAYGAGLFSRKMIEKYEQDYPQKGLRSIKIKMDISENRKIAKECDKCIEELDRIIRDYINNQEKAIQSIRRYRLRNSGKKD